MNRIPLLAAAIVPLAVSAGDKDLADWSLDKVKDDQRLSTVLDAEVYTSDGREIGAVHDVLFDREGRASVLIESNERLTRESVSGKSDADRPRQKEEKAFGRVSQTDNPSTRDNTNYQATDDLSRTSAIADEQTRSTVAKMDWSDIEFDVAHDAIMVDADRIEFTDTIETYRAMDRVAIAEKRGADSSIEEQTRPITNRNAPIGADARDDERGEDARQGGHDSEKIAGHVLATSLLGMDVNLDTDESFGRIEDVLLNDRGEASAFVVDSWDLFDKERYAIPADISAVDPASGEINLDYTEEEVTNLDEFDFDELSAERM